MQPKNYERKEAKRVHTTHVAAVSYLKGFHCVFEIQLLFIATAQRDDQTPS